MCSYCTDLDQHDARHGHRCNDECATSCDECGAPICRDDDDLLSLEEEGLLYCVEGCRQKALAREPGPLRVLYVEDNADLLEIVPDFLRSHFPSIAFTVAANMREAVKALQGQCFNFVISDYHLPDGNGGRIYRRMQDLGIDTRFVLCSSDLITKEGMPALYGTGIEELDKSKLHKSLVGVIKTLEAK